MVVTNTIAKIKAYFDKWHTKEAHLDTVYPIGSIYMTIDNYFYPNTEFGGTWIKIQGRFLIGSGIAPEDSNITYTTNNVGGTKKTQLINHTHAQDAHIHTQDGHTHTQNAHKHGPFYDTTYNTNFHYMSADGPMAEWGTAKNLNKIPNATLKEGGRFIMVSSELTDVKTRSATTLAIAKNQQATANIKPASSPIKNTGSLNENNDGNMPPYLVVNIWQRTG